MLRDLRRKDANNTSDKEIPFVTNIGRKTKGIASGLVSRSALLLAQSFQRSFGVEISKRKKRKKKIVRPVEPNLPISEDAKNASEEPAPQKAKPSHQDLARLRDDGAMLALEQRIVFDAAAAVTAEAAADDVAEQQAAEVATGDGEPSESNAQQLQGEAELVAALGQIDPSSGGQQIAFIDSGVDDILSLIHI